jgi:hypothetical protein
MDIDRMKHRRREEATEASVASGRARLVAGGVRSGPFAAR